MAATPANDLLWSLVFGDLLQKLLHDLRPPLGSILIWSELMRHEHLSDTAGKAVQSIGKAADTICGILDDLGLFTRRMAPLEPLDRLADTLPALIRLSAAPLAADFSVLHGGRGSIDRHLYTASFFCALRGALVSISMLPSASLASAFEIGGGVLTTRLTLTGDEVTLATANWGLLSWLVEAGGGALLLKESGDAASISWTVPIVAEPDELAGPLRP